MDAEGKHAKSRGYYRWCWSGKVSWETSFCEQFSTVKEFDKKQDRKIKWLGE